MTALTTVIGRGTTAAKPAATAVPTGSLYFDTDLVKLQRSNGTTWDDCAETVTGTPGLTLIATHTTGVGGEASYTFSAIAGTYKHLRVVWMARLDTTVNTIRLQLNGDTGSNYTSVYVEGTSTVNGTVAAAAASARVGIASGTAQPATLFDEGEIGLRYYADTNHLKMATYTCTRFDATTSGFTEDGRVLWNNAAAITSVKLLAGAGNFIQNSRFDLYGQT